VAKYHLTTSTNLIYQLNMKSTLLLLNNSDWFTFCSR